MKLSELDVKQLLTSLGFLEDNLKDVLKIGVDDATRIEVYQALIYCLRIKKRLEG